MKLSTQEQLDAHAAASVRGAIEGTVASGAVALAGTYYASRISPFYRSLPLSLKALGLVIVVAPCLSIQAERRGLEYDRSTWEGEGMRIIDEKAMEKDRRWQAMTMKDKVGDWASRHEYSIILGGWAASMGVAGGIISRQKYQTYSQKIVQARMWAQALTIGLIIGAGILTQSKRMAQIKEGHGDHSWQDLLDQQERDRQQAAQALVRAKTSPSVTHD